MAEQMRENSTVKQQFNEISRPSDKWIQEIIHDTEHYFQGEIQHDQRASWLLATDGLIITIIIGFVVTSIDKSYLLSTSLLIICLACLVLSALISILVILPMRGTKPLWHDLAGKAHRRDARYDVDRLIQERFRHDLGWSDESYERRVKYHFRSHYLRYSKKSYAILWASALLFVALVSAVAVVMSVYLQ